MGQVLPVVVGHAKDIQSASAAQQRLLHRPGISVSSELRAQRTFLLIPCRLQADTHLVSKSQNQTRQTHRPVTLAAQPGSCCLHLSSAWIPTAKRLGAKTCTQTRPGSQLHKSVSQRGTG